MKQKLTQLLVITIVLIVSIAFYALTLRGIVGNPQVSQFKNNLDQVTKPFELSPERGRYLLVMSLGDNHSFALTKEMALAGYPDVGYLGNKFYVYFAPGISLLALPFYLIGKSLGYAQVFSYGIISVFAVFNLLLLYFIAKNIFKFRSSTAIFIPLVFGFATTSWSYAITLYQHHVTLFFILSGIYAAWRYKLAARNNWVYSLYVWFAYGASIFLDYPNVVLLAPMMIYHLSSAFRIERLKIKTNITFRLSYIVTSLIFFVLVGIHGYYNYVNFGSPLRLSGSLSSVKEIKEDKNVRNDTNAQELEKLENSKSVAGFFNEDAFPKGLSILTASRDRGLLFYSPILLLGIIGLLISLHKISSEKAALIGTVLVNFFLYSSWGDPWGGWAYGSRYLIISMAVLSIFSGFLFTKVKKTILSVFLKIVTLLLFIYSSATALLGALTTNAVPPKIEADFLKMHYNYLHNWIFFERGQSGSFAFNTYFSKYVTLQQYAFGIWGFVILIAIILLFVLPLFEKHESDI